SDIFSLGAVLYEMATGRKAFKGDTQASVIGAILHKDPAPMAPARPGQAGAGLGPMPALRRLVSRCLAKDPARRWQSARDVMLELEAISLGEGGRARAPLPWVPSAFALGWMLAVIFAVASLALAFAWWRRSPAEIAPIRFSIPPPENAMLLQGAAISPDGRRLVFRANGPDGRILLWLRALDSVTPQPLPETDGGVNPFWSPDGRSIAFWSQGKLKKIEAEAPFGHPETICSAPAVASGAWNRSGVIIFSTGSGGGLSRAPAEGGAPAPLTALDPHENAHLWPQFLPDGRHFLYLSRTKDREDEAIYVSALDSPAARKRLVPTDVAAAYAPPQRGTKGLLLFLRGGTLMAQPFDAAALQLSGEPWPVAERVDQTVLAGFAFFSVSNNDVLAYRSGGGVDSQLVWFDRAGKQLGTVGSPGRYRNPRLSPDGRQVAVERIDPSNGVADIWVQELSRGTVVRLTYRPVADITPIWSPDGARIIFASERDGPRSLFQKDASGAGKEELLLKTRLRLVGALDWSSDGRFVLYDTTSGETRRDLWALPLFGNRKPFAVLHEAFGEYQGQFSPDGRRIAYASDESSALEVYAQNFSGSAVSSGPGGKLRVSTDGGSEPQWRRDGKELFYLAADHKLMAVEVKPGAKLQLGAPRALFDTHIRFTSVTRNHYAVTADGQRFLLNLPLEDTAASPITVVVNWAAGLKR
ncbi:MAG TPA: hypothetical protein VEU62_01700, partial [Bryobacterales bacterium]|nr:hypothetical protein [Bryobacterales bacterium]